MENTNSFIDYDDPLVKERAKINPYYRSLGIFLSRLYWDLHPESWRSRRIVRSWHNRFLNKKAVILCNGPTLLKSDLSLLKNVFTFGLNKINLLFDTSDFRPSCIIAVNQYVIKQNVDFFNKTEIPLFIDSLGAHRKLIKRRKNVAFIHSSSKGFARDCSFSVNQGYTVTFVALQLAFHMGFKEVALIGADHNFVEKGPANKIISSTKVDENHFDPRYFSGGDNWQLPDLLQSEFSYGLARKVYQAFGRRIVNATEGGSLEIFDRETLKEFLDG